MAGRALLLLLLLLLLVLAPMPLLARWEAACAPAKVCAPSLGE